MSPSSPSRRTSCPATRTTTGMCSCATCAAASCGGATPAADGGEAEGFSGPSAISPDGHVVTFTSTASNLVAGGANHHWDVFARDLRTGVLSAVSVADDGTWGNADSISSAISRHGRRVTFSSSASNLVAGDTNGRPDVF